MNRKIVSIVLALCMVVCLMAGCDTQQEQKGNEPLADVTVRVGAMTGRPRRRR